MINQHKTKYGGGMFGLNDNNQSTANQAAGDNPTSQPPMPPSPFIDNSSDPTPSAPAPMPEPTTSPAMPEPAGPAPSPNQDALVSIKEQALTNLAPLVNHLDQTPEEKFKTTMMLIQASDNSQLVKDAYEAAQNIPDEKARAQALLDVVNEINYFTQKESKN
jgi:hypothetical protein